MRNDLQHFEMELDWARGMFDELFQENGEIVPGTEWITLYSKSLTIIELEDKIHLLKKADM